MNVLFITQWYPNREQTFFGIFVREQVRAVQSAGHTVQVLALSLHKSKELFKKKIYHYTDEFGIKTIQCEIHSIVKDLIFHLPYFQQYFLNRTIKQELEQLQPDIIHSQVIYPAGLWGGALAQQLHLPHVITEHWSRLSDFSSTIYFPKARKVYAAAHCILPVSTFLKKNIQRLVPELGDEKFTVTGNVVDSELFRYQPLENTTNELTFCAVATWQHKKKPDKMPELFIGALSQLQRNTGRHINLIMIGGGDRLNELRQLCKSAEISARFTGFIAKEQIAEEFRRVDYFVHASTIETFSIVVAEALASGLPVICSNVGALPELVDSGNGILCDNTLDSWSDALEQVLSIDYNREKIAEKLQTRFSRESIGRQITNVYEKATIKQQN
jgi:glycosyltransferase involved in cell wall biosynthesis